MVVLFSLVVEIVEFVDKQQIVVFEEAEVAFVVVVDQVFQF
jgi:hypothetical protein